MNQKLYTTVDKGRSESCQCNISKFGSLMWIMQCHSATSELFLYTIPEKTETLVIPCDGHRNRFHVLSSIVSLLGLYYHHVRASVVYAGLWYPSSRVQTRPKSLDFSGHLKNPPHAFLRRGSERICPMSQLCGM